MYDVERLMICEILDLEIIRGQIFLKISLHTEGQKNNKWIRYSECKNYTDLVDEKREK